MALSVCLCLVGVLGLVVVLCIDCDVFDACFLCVCIYFCVFSVCFVIIVIFVLLFVCLM